MEITAIYLIGFFAAKFFYVLVTCVYGDEKPDTHCVVNLQFQSCPPDVLFNKFKHVFKAHAVIPLLTTV